MSIALFFQIPVGLTILIVKMLEDKARRLSPQSADEEELEQENGQGTEPKHSGCFSLTSATNVMRDSKAGFTFLGPVLHTGERSELDLVCTS